MKITKPNKLIKGDTVALISPSCGLPSVFPQRYEAGKKQLIDTFDINVIETPNALKSMEELYQNPKARAEDLMWAFQNPDVKAIIATIGGDESVRILPHLDLDIIKNNPKIFMGYSDPTVIHFACLKAGISSVYGPTVMSGLAENCGISTYTQNSMVKTLFSSDIIGEVPQNYDGWTNEMLSWAEPSNQNIKRKLTPCSGWNFIQGTKTAQGHLIGGCFEVMMMLTGCPVFPSLEEWEGAILFIETSEEDVSPDIFMWWLRNLGAIGILERINGIIMGRPDTKDDNIQKYDNALLKALNEFGRDDLPVIAQMDFGHTEPMFLIPYGLKAEINPTNKTFSILESAVK